MPMELGICAPMYKNVDAPLDCMPMTRIRFPLLSERSGNRVAYSAVRDGHVSAACARSVEVGYLSSDDVSGLAGSKSGIRGPAGQVAATAA